jgi:ATP-dependent Clp protease adapter protein ClpS
MSDNKTGNLKIIIIKGIPVYVHWSLLLAGLLISINAKFAIPETIYLCIGYTLLIILHELGHAYVARYFGLKVLSIEISGAGGLCLTETPPTFIAAIAFSSAGILAQAFLLLGTVLYLITIENAPSVFSTCLVISFIIANGVIIVLNLIPWKRHIDNFGTDGYLLWKLIVNRIRGKSYVFPDTSATFSPKMRLTQLQGYMPPDFKTGIEILNDNNTTMEFVVTALTTHLNIPREEAIEMMLDIHSKGGILISLPSYEIANKAADAITSDAKKSGFKLICRTVDVQQLP